MALLAQANILGWGQSWPLFLILIGLLLLAERAALAAGRISAASGHAVAERECRERARRHAANAGHGDRAG